MYWADEACSIAEHALQIRLQSLGKAHPKTVATHTLSSGLVQKQTTGAKSMAAGQDMEAGHADNDKT